MMPRFSSDQKLSIVHEYGPHPAHTRCGYDLTNSWGNAEAGRRSQCAHQLAIRLNLAGNHLADEMALQGPACWLREVRGSQSFPLRSTAPITISFPEPAACH